MRDWMRDVKGTEGFLPRGVSRDQRVSRSVQADGRRLPSPRGGGRAWINGREVGGADRRYAHLTPSYD
jgi:hypothetical protein